MKIDLEICHLIQAYRCLHESQGSFKGFLSGASNFRSVISFHRQLKSLMARVFHCASEFFIVHKDLLVVVQLIIFSNANKDS